MVCAFLRFGVSSSGKASVFVNRVVNDQCM